MLGFSILIGHLLGDFVFQSDPIAKRKGSSSYYCAIHCLVYTLMMTVAVDTYCVVYGESLWPIWAWATIFLTHYVIDRNDLASHLMEASWIDQKGFKERCAPWSKIIIDNTMHLICAWITAMLVYASTH